MLAMRTFVTLMIIVAIALPVHFLLFGLVILTGAMGG